MTPTVSYFMLLGGLLVAYIEFLRPGLVVPGVMGGVVAMWALSRLASYGLNWRLQYLVGFCSSSETTPGDRSQSGGSGCGSVRNCDGGFTRSGVSSSQKQSFSLSACI